MRVHLASGVTVFTKKQSDGFFWPMLTGASIPLSSHVPIFDNVSRSPFLVGVCPALAICCMASTNRRADVHPYRAKRRTDWPGAVFFIHSLKERTPGYLAAY